MIKNIKYSISNIQYEKVLKFKFKVYFQNVNSKNLKIKFQMCVENNDFLRKHHQGQFPSGPQQAWWKDFQG